MSDHDVRWKQRYQQFGNAYALLKASIGIQKPSVDSRACGNR